MALNPFIPTESSTHQTFRNGYNANMTEAETRISNAETNITIIQSNVSGLQSNTGSYAPTGHQHVLADITDAGTMAAADTGDYSQTGHQHVVADITNLDGDFATMSVPANTTISAFGATLVDDADASAARTTLGAAATSHTHVVTDINSAAAPSGYVITSDGSGNATWEESQGGGGNAFSLVTVTTATYTQIPQHTHHNYDDTNLGGSGSGSGGGACIVVDLLDPTLHVAVTTHKKIGNSCDVLLLPPSGCTIDGIISDGSGSGYVLTSQYESISIYSDGVSGYYIQ